jgi:Ca-activated chloride channel family protein
VPVLPLHVGLAIDRSGSMDGDKLRAARDAAVGVLDALRDGEHLAAVAFDETVADVCPSVQLNNEARRALRPLLRRIESGGSTALFDGFSRAAGLVAHGAEGVGADAWVIVLSDGMGNHGLVDPPTMRHHARVIADGGVRTISVGIGADYQASQLTALSDGGNGAFHHASRPGEIVEIVLGELRALRHVTVRDLGVNVVAQGAHRFSLLGGEVVEQGQAGSARFARVGARRSVQVVVLVWPRYPQAMATLHVDARWTDAERGARAAGLEVETSDGPAVRNVELAQRAARVWHARIVGMALELNERGEYERAERYVRRWERRFRRYVQGLPAMEELVASLSAIGGRVGRTWGTAGHKEAYVMARKGMLFEAELRQAAPASFSDALGQDKPGHA